MNEEEPLQKNKKVRFSKEAWLVIAFLLVVIAGTLFAWKPWASQNGANDRTIQVTGEAKITQEPDEYVFYPEYEFNALAKETALDALSAKSEEVVSKLEQTGVDKSKIKVDSSGYDNNLLRQPEAAGNVYTLRLTATVPNKDLAQKVQNYLASTSPKGQVSPMAGFSDGKRKELENKARDEATKDARNKADQSARNLNFKVGKVKSVADGAGFAGAVPLSKNGVSPAIAEDTARAQSLPVQPGENSLHYSVTVVYYLK